MTKVQEFRKQKADNKKLPANLEPVELVAGQSGIVLLAYVHWFANTNASRVVSNRLRANANNPGLFEAIRDGGWKPEHAPVVIPMTAAESKAAVAERNGLLAAWRSSESDDEKRMASLMADIWADHVPKFRGHTGNSRGTSLPWILLSLADKLAGEGKQFDTAYSIPVVVRQYSSKMAELIDQIQENSDRTLKGVVNLTGQDQLVAAKAIMAAGGIQADVERALGQRGAAQKAWHIISAGLMDRCLMDTPEGFSKNPTYEKGGYVPVSRIRQDKLAVAIKEGKVEAYLQAIIEGTSNETKVVDKKAWQAIQSVAEVGSPMRLIADSHLSGVGLAEVYAKYPELYVAGYVGSVASAVVEKPAKVGRSRRK